MKKVFISNEMGVDDRLLEVYDRSPEASLFFPWLIAACDDWGRLSGNARVVKAQTVPVFDAFTPEIIENFLAIYEATGLIYRYLSEGRPFLCLRPKAWWRYQNHIPREKRLRDLSKIPPPPVQHWNSTISVSQDEAADLEQETPVNFANSGEIQREEQENCSSLSPSPSPSPSPSLSTSVVAEPRRRGRPRKEATPRVMVDHPNFAFFQVFDEILGSQCTATVLKDRALVANELRFAGYTADQARTALINWPKIWTVPLSVRGLVRNMSTLLAGRQPRTDGRGSAVSATTTWLSKDTKHVDQTSIRGWNEPAVGELPGPRQLGGGQDSRVGNILDGDFKVGVD